MHLELIKIISVSLLFAVVKRKLPPLLAGLVQGGLLLKGLCNKVAKSCTVTNPVSLLEAVGLC